MPVPIFFPMVFLNKVFQNQLHLVSYSANYGRYLTDHPFKLINALFIYWSLRQGFSVQSCCPGTHPVDRLASNLHVPLPHEC